MKTFERFDDIKVLRSQVDAFSELFSGFWNLLKRAISYGSLHVSRGRLGKHVQRTRRYENYSFLEVKVKYFKWKLHL